jgi:hypothetical protein
MDLLDAMFQMDAAIEMGTTNIRPFIVSAEVSRLLGNTPKAVRILEEGLEREPDNVVLLNNLAYTLASDPSRVAEALPFVPRLLAVETYRTQAMDTAVFVLIKANEMERAEPILDELERMAEERGPLWFRTHMRRAEIALRRGRPRAAVDTLALALKSSRGVPDEDVSYANRLLVEAREQSQPPREAEASPPPPEQETQP